MIRLLEEMIFTIKKKKKKNHLFRPTCFKLVISCSRVDIPFSELLYFNTEERKEIWQRLKQDKKIYFNIFFTIFVKCSSKLVDVEIAKKDTALWDSTFLTCVSCSTILKLPSNRQNDFHVYNRNLLIFSTVRIHGEWKALEWLLSISRTE